MSTDADPPAKKRRVHLPVAGLGAASAGAVGYGAMALGAVAVGVFAVGALVIGGVALSRRKRNVETGETVVDTAEHED
jgi:hypothetical protein